MAIAKRVGKKIKATPNRRVSVTKKMELPEVTLPTKLSKAARRIENYVWWLHGMPGIGKTTTAMQFPDAMLISCRERGGKALEAYQRTAAHWLELVAYIDKLEKDDDKFKFVVIDTPEGAFELCFNFMCDEVLHIEDPSLEEDYGKSWNEIYTEYFRQMDRLMMAKGVVLCSHTSEKKYKPFKGVEYDGFRPAIRDKVFTLLNAKVDILGYMYNDGENTLMRIRTDGSCQAKNRANKQFRYTNGKKIAEFKLGNDEEEAFSSIMTAFNNGLEPPVKRKIPRKKRKED